MRPAQLVERLKRGVWVRDRDEMRPAQMSKGCNG